MMTVQPHIDRLISAKTSCSLGLTLLAGLMLAGNGTQALAQSRIVGFDRMQQCVSMNAQFQYNSIARNRFTSTPSVKSRNAFKKLQVVNQFFKKEFNWSGPANRNTPINLNTNYARSEGTKCNPVFATMASRYAGGKYIFWMSIGYSKPNSAIDIADDIDVIGHEFTHGTYMSHMVNTGVVSTLEMRSMNEGFADTFGLTAAAWQASGRSLKNTVVRSNSFQLGRVYGSIIRPNRGMPTRDVSNPARTGVEDFYPDWRAKKSIYSRGRGSPHPGSGIISLPFKLMVAGGRHPRSRTNINVVGIGFEKSIKIFHYIVRNRLRFSGYRSFAAAVRNAARNIHGVNSREYITADRAFAAVGLGISGKNYSANQPAPTKSQPTRTTPTKIPTVYVPKPKPQPTAQPSSGPKSQPAVSKGPKVSGVSLLVALGVILGSLIFIISTLHRRRFQAVTRQQQGSNRLYDPSNHSDFQPAVYDASADSSGPAPIKPKAAILKKKVQTTRAGQIDCAVSVNGQQHSLSLTITPTAFGREMSQADIRAALISDGSLSRHHFDLWYKAEGDYLYAFCHSGNGMNFGGHQLSKGEKAKIDFGSGVTIFAGKTEFKITKSENK